MLINSQLVKDHFGQFYKIHTSKDKQAPAALDAESFRSNSQAKSFINNLIAPVSFWSKIYHSESLVNNTLQNENHLKEEIAELLHKGKVKVFKIGIPSLSDHPPEKRTVQDSNKNNHTFTTASTLLISSPKEVKQFSSKVEAEKYLSEISADDEQLKSIANELDLPVDDLGATSLSSVIATSLASGEVIVIVDRYSAPPANPADQGENFHTDRSTSIGPQGTTGVGGVLAGNSAITDCNCTINTVTATCSHSRSAGPNGVLQIVPTPNKNKMTEYELMGAKLTIKQEFAGTDSVDCSVNLQNNKSSGCFFITGPDNQLINSASSNLIFDGETAEVLDKWPIKASPEIFNVLGHGCDKAGKTVTIEKYPNQYFTVQGDLSIFKDWSDKVNKGWENWGNSIFDISPVEIQPKITGPTGSFVAHWGWKEDKDWRSYFNVSCDFGLNPILGIEIKVTLSMGTIAYTAAGLPPNVAKLAAKHLLDLLLSIGVGCKASLTGKPSGKFYPDSTKKITGEGKFTAEGNVILEITVRVGSDYVISAELSVSGEAKVTGDDLVTLDETGLFLQSTIMLSPFIGTAKVKVRIFKIRTRTKEKKWEPWKKIELYKSENRKILPR